MADLPLPIIEYLQQIGSNIYVYRHRKGYTMQELGEDVGVHKSAISKIESGKNLTLETLLKIASALDVHPSVLMEGAFVLKDYDLERYVKLKQKVRKRAKKETHPKVKKP